MVINIIDVLTMVGDVATSSSVKSVADSGVLSGPI